MNQTRSKNYVQINVTPGEDGPVYNVTVYYWVGAQSHTVRPMAPVSKLVAKYLDKISNYYFTSIMSGSVFIHPGREI